MPRKTPTPLPDALRYLQPFVNSLAKLPPEELNEEVDATRLEAALRKRLKGLDEDKAERALANDRGLLQRWLKTTASPIHPAHWVLGFLSLPELAEQLTRPPVPPMRGPLISFDAPAGCTVKPAPFRLDLKKGKLLGTITAASELHFDNDPRSWEGSARIKRPGVKMTFAISDVRFGECVGKKCVVQTVVPAAMKEVRYVLRVPGGYAAVWLGTPPGIDFDESSLEPALHTVRVSPCGVQPTVDTGK